MARPKKPLSQLRLHCYSLRLTASENDSAQKSAELAGLSVGNWLRLNALSKKELRITTTPMHRAYYKQLVGVANNINQIARKFNNSGQISTDFQELRELLSKIYTLFQK